MIQQEDTLAVRNMTIGMYTGVGIIVLLIVIGLLANRLWMGKFHEEPAELRHERLKPVGQLNVARQTTMVAPPLVVEKKPKTAEEIYKTVCTVCHATGISGAPKFGNQADWAPRIAKGKEVLFQNATKGLNAMPPRGGADVSDDELKATVQYMLDAVENTATSPNEVPKADAPKTEEPKTTEPTASKPPVSINEQQALPQTSQPSMSGTTSLQKKTVDLTVNESETVPTIASEDGKKKASSESTSTAGEVANTTAASPISMAETMPEMPAIAQAAMSAAQSMLDTHDVIAPTSTNNTEITPSTVPQPTVSAEIKPILTPPTETVVSQQEPKLEATALPSSAPEVEKVATAESEATSTDSSQAMATTTEAQSQPTKVATQEVTESSLTQPSANQGTETAIQSQPTTATVEETKMTTASASVQSQPLTTQGAETASQPQQAMTADPEIKATVASATDSTTPSMAPTTAEPTASPTLASPVSEPTTIKQPVVAESKPVEDKPATTAEPDLATFDLTLGEKTYKTICFNCHNIGLLGAPKLGDKEAWVPRITQGLETLFQHSLTGFKGKVGVMPPKGGQVHVPDANIKAAVAYMVSKVSP